MASLAGVDCDGGPGPGAIYGYDYWSKRKGGSGCGLLSSRLVDGVAAESPATCLGEAAGRSSRSGGGGVLLRSLDHHGPARDGAAKRFNESGGRDRHRAR